MEHKRNVFADQYRTQEEKDAIERLRRMRRRKNAPETNNSEDELLTDPEQNDGNKRAKLSAPVMEMRVKEEEPDEPDEAREPEGQVRVKEEIEIPEELMMPHYSENPFEEQQGGDQLELPKEEIQDWRLMIDPNPAWLSEQSDSDEDEYDYNNTFAYRPPTPPKPSTNDMVFDEEPESTWKSRSRSPSVEYWGYIPAKRETDTIVKQEQDMEAIVNQSSSSTSPRSQSYRDQSQPDDRDRLIDSRIRSSQSMWSMNGNALKQEENDQSSSSRKSRSRSRSSSAEYLALIPTRNQTGTREKRKKSPLSSNDDDQGPLRPEQVINGGNTKKSCDEEPESTWKSRSRSSSVEFLGSVPAKRQAEARVKQEMEAIVNQSSSSISRKSQSYREQNLPDDRDSLIDSRIRSFQSMWSMNGNALKQEKNNQSSSSRKSRSRSRSSSAEYLALIPTRNRTGTREKREKEATGNQGSSSSTVRHDHCYESHASPHLEPVQNIGEMSSPFSRYQSSNFGRSSSSSSDDDEGPLRPEQVINGEHFIDHRLRNLQHEEMIRMNNGENPCVSNDDQRQLSSSSANPEQNTASSREETMKRILGYSMSTPAEHHPRYPIREKLVQHIRPALATLSKSTNCELEISLEHGEGLYSWITIKGALSEVGKAKDAINEWVINYEENKRIPDRFNKIVTISILMDVPISVRRHFIGPEKQPIVQTLMDSGGLKVSIYSNQFRVCEAPLWIKGENHVVKMAYQEFKKILKTAAEKDGDEKLAMERDMKIVEKEKEKIRKEKEEKDKLERERVKRRMEIEESRRIKREQKSKRITENSNEAHRSARTRTVMVQRKKVVEERGLTLATFQSSVLDIEAIFDDRNANISRIMARTKTNIWLLQDIDPDHLVRQFLIKGKADAVEMALEEVRKIPQKPRGV